MKSIELESLLQNTQFITQELASIKHDIENQMTHADYPETSAVSYIERAIKLRQSFRSIADGIEAKRSLVQLQKEKIQKSKNFIQGLQYYKTTLISKIKQSHIDVVDLHQFEESPLKVNDWIEDYPTVDNHLQQELHKKQEKKDQLKTLIRHKTDKEQEGKSKKELYQKILPERAHKIYQEVLETAKLCDIIELESFSSIQNPKLSVVYEKLNPLRINSTVEVNYTKDIHEELQITILKNDFKLFKMANLNKISLNEKEVKLTITSLEAPLNQLVIGLHRREDFSNEEVFQRLFNDEVTKPVFSHPQNESERNINAKYIKVDWLEDSFLTGVISPMDLINTIKERVFSLMLLAYISENIKKLGFFFPLTSEEEEDQGPISLQTVLKKTMTGSLEKMTFREYLDQVHIPSWVEKYRLKYLQIEAQKQKMDFEGQSRFSIDKSNYLNVLKLLKLEELEEANLNTYYKGSLSIHQGKLEFILIVPIAYPHKLSKITITDWQKKDEEKKLTGLENIACIAKINPPKRTFSKKIMTFEREVNESIHSFYRDPENQPFRVLLQINRLISLLGLHAQKRL